MKKSLIELISLLTRGEIDPEVVEKIAIAVLEAPQNEDYEWVSPEVAMALHLLWELEENSASGDKLDEIHEYLQQLDEELPDFPTEYEDVDIIEYYKWLDGHLAKRNLDIINMSSGNDDNNYIFIVNRSDVANILKLAKTIFLTENRAYRPIDFFSGVC